jgi:hypothetical protein
MAEAKTHHDCRRRPCRPDARHRLRQREVPVTIHEAGHYPRHRVCGEFISGRGQATLARLGLRELINQAGAVSARTAAFFSATKSTAPRPCRRRPSAFRVSAGRRAGEKFPRTRRRIVRRQTLRQRILPKASSAPPAAGRRPEPMAALVWPENSRAQRRAHRRSGNARFAARLRRPVQNQWRRGECLRPVPQARGRKMGIKKLAANCCCGQPGFAVAPAARQRGVR